MGTDSPTPVPGPHEKKDFEEDDAAVPKRGRKRASADEHEIEKEEPQTEDTADTEKPKKGNGKGKKRAITEEHAQETPEETADTKKRKKGKGKQQQGLSEQPASSSTTGGPKPKAKAKTSTAKKEEPAEEPAGEDKPAKRRFKRADFGDIRIPNFKDYFATGQLENFVHVSSLSACHGVAYI